MARFALRLVAALVASLVLVEAGFRVLLFASWEPIARRAAALREAPRLASIDEEVFWTLRYVLDREELAAVRLERPRLAHPELGWLAWHIDPSTLEHRDEATLAGRRPVLVFGDSFARCTTTEMRCWEQFLEESPLAAEYAVLNYGVNAYGFDQAILLMQRVLPRFVDRDPVVVLTLLVDDDLDRCDLRLREWPKPHFALAADGGLTLELPSPLSLSEYVREHPPRVVSYAWRYVSRSRSARSRQPESITSSSCSTSSRRSSACGAATGASPSCSTSSSVAERA